MVARHDLRVGDRQTERPAEQRHDGIPVGQSPTRWPRPRRRHVPPKPSAPARSAGATTNRAAVVTSSIVAANLIRRRDLSRSAVAVSKARSHTLRQLVICANAIGRATVSRHDASFLPAGPSLWQAGDVSALYSATVVRRKKHEGRLYRCRKHGRPHVPQPLQAQQSCGHGLRLNPAAVKSCTDLGRDGRDVHRRSDRGADS